MQLRNAADRYGVIAITLHWVMAVLIIGLIVIGIYMVNIPVSLLKLRLFGWHKEYGMLVLILVMLRVVWRLMNILPSLPGHLPAVQKVAAYSAHYAFYIFMFAMPLTGWMLSSAAGLSVSFFGLFVLPDLVSPDTDLRLLLTEIHQWLGYALIALICLHASAALHHHFYYKDDILRRMLP